MSTINDRRRSAFNFLMLFHFFFPLFLPLFHFSLEKSQNRGFNVCKFRRPDEDWLFVLCTAIEGEEKFVLMLREPVREITGFQTHTQLRFHCCDLSRVFSLLFGLSARKNFISAAWKSRNREDALIVIAENKGN